MSDELLQRPEIKAPLFSVGFYKPELVTPGYWFVGPYADIAQKPPAPKYYHACQTGPHIYDGYGVGSLPSLLLDNCHV